MKKMNKDKLEKMIEQGYNFRNFQTFELRAKERTEEHPEEMIIEGVACVFETETTIFEYDGVEYKEKVDKNALDDADLSNVIFNYNHGGRVYARTKNRSLELEKKEDGLHVLIKLDPEDEGHRQLYHDIKKGLIDTMSYAYTVREASYDEQKHLRTILKIKKVYDVSAVDIPAYETTSISVRSFFEMDESKIMKLENEILKEKKKQKRQRIASAIEIEKYLISH